jgi:hypothetical protein
MARLHGDEADLYERHHARLRCDVASYVRAADAIVDDACAHAWAQLLAHQPRRSTVASWLWHVAVREAWRLERRERREWTSGEPRDAECRPIEDRHRWLETPRRAR